MALHSFANPLGNISTMIIALRSRSRLLISNSSCSATRTGDLSNFSSMFCKLIKVVHGLSGR